jgi:hypothetical protein
MIINTSRTVISPKIDLEGKKNIIVSGKKRNQILAKSIFIVNFF